MPSLRPNALITDFTGGEISPRWQARVQGGGYDPLQGGGSIADRYRSGCKELTNAIVLPQGGVARRQALFAARGITNDVPEGADLAKCRVIKFEHPDSDFLVVFSNEWLGVYDTTDLGVDTLPPPVFTATTPYEEDEVADVQPAQFQNGLVLLHSSHRMHQLKYINDVWSFSDVLNDGYVAPLFNFNDANSPPRTKASFTVVFTENVNRTYRVIVSGEPIYSYAAQKFTVVADTPGDTVTSLENALNKTAAVVAGTASVVHTGLTSADPEFTVEYEFIGTAGDRSGQLEFSASGYLPSAETDLWTIASVEDGTGGAEPLWSGPIYVEHDGVYYQCIEPHVADAASEPGTGVDWEDYWTSLGATLPDGVDYSTMESGEEWALDLVYAPGNRGWPSTGTIHEQRLVANGPPGARAVVVGSRTGVYSYLNFEEGEDSSDGFLFVLAVENGASIQWLHSQTFLFVGTTVGLFVQTERPLTPTNVGFSQQSAYTLSTLRGFNVAGEVFCVQRNARQMRRVQYVEALQSWQATDLTSPVEHWFYRRAYGCENQCKTIVDVAYQNSPDSVLWVLRSDGTLLSLTYERFYDVAAWAKHSTRRGQIVSIESFFGGTPGMDGVAMLVVRESDSGSYLMLEVMPETTRNDYQVLADDDGEWTYQAAPVDEWPMYLDSAVEREGDGTAVVETPPRFDGVPVSVVENGVLLGEYTPAGGEIVLPFNTVNESKIFVGLNYKTRIVPVKFEGAANYTSQSNKVRWTRPVLRLFNSVLPSVNGQVPRERAAGDSVYDEYVRLFTGDIEIANLGFDGELVIESELPFPFQLSGVFGLMNMEGR